MLTCNYYSMAESPHTLPKLQGNDPLKPQSWSHYLLRSRLLSPLLQCSSSQPGLPTLFFFRSHALALMSIVCHPPYFVGILKHGSQYPHLGFQALGRILQLSRGLPTNLNIDHPLTLSFWMPLFLLYFESVVVQSAILPPFLAFLMPSHFVVLPPHCIFLHRYLHLLYFLHPPV